MNEAALCPGKSLSDDQTGVQTRGSSSSSIAAPKCPSQDRSTQSESPAPQETLLAVQSGGLETSEALLAASDGGFHLRSQFTAVLVNVKSRCGHTSPAMPSHNPLILSLPLVETLEELQTMTSSSSSSGSPGSSDADVVEILI